MGRALPGVPDPPVRLVELTVSVSGVKIALTADQVADIALAAAGSGHGVPAPLLSWLDPVALASPSLARDPRLCKTLIVGLAVLLSFPVGGELRGVKEVADELGVGTSSGHRYVLTLKQIGVLAEDPATRRYRRVGR